MQKLSIGSLLIILFFSCSNIEQDFQLINLDIPNDVNSSEPSLHKAKDGTIYLNWFETNKDDVTSLKLATLKDNKWSNISTVASSSNWFVNWADFPSITSFGDNLVIHYLEKSAEDTYAYDVKLLTSNDKGATWNNAFTPHTDGTQTEHGFVSKTALNEESYLTVWLDGRQMAYAKKDSTVTSQMSLRAAIINSKNKIINEYTLDKRTCDCCQTDTALTNEGPIVVYRDRTAHEIRDIYYTKQLNDTTWSQPKPLYNDNWKIGGCPVNGPAISAKNDNVAVSWFTVANDNPQVKVSFSKNNGNTFETPILIGNSKTLGRVDVEMLDEDSAIVSWMETENGQTVINIQQVFNNGDKSNVFTVSKSNESRSSGFPRITIKGEQIIIAWTQVGELLKVNSAIINTNVFK
ncbi:hypothetical protein [Pontimicrobium sp. IMCC45349]|uniref:hypothetical protein n=1 Tax=Pontimicrobium sp. IMCC45349 TaxID=3391574 RepID=UPI0039A30C13